MSAEAIELYARAIAERVDAFRAAEQRCAWLPRFDACTLPPRPTSPHADEVAAWVAASSAVLRSWSQRCAEADAAERRRLRQLREGLTLARALVVGGIGRGDA